MKRFFGFKRGDTLVEVSIAMGILSLLLAVGTTSAIRAYRLATLARERSVAYNIAQQQANALRAYTQSRTWDKLIDVADTTSPSLANVVKNWGGPNPSVFPDTAPVPTNSLDPSSITSSNIGALTSATPVSSDSFYMALDTSSGLPAWKIGSTAATQAQGQFYVTIVPNVANTSNVACADFTTCGATTNLLRFDILVLWTTRISGAGAAASNQISSSVIYISRPEAK